MIFHTHVHVIPRFAGVTLKPHTAETVEADELARHAEKLRAVLGQPLDEDSDED